MPVYQYLRLPEKPSNLDHLIPAGMAPDLDVDLSVAIDVLGDAVVLVAGVEAEGPLPGLWEGAQDTLQRQRQEQEEGFH